MVRAAFLTDPPTEFDLKKDSTLSLMRAAVRRGWQVFQFEQPHLYLRRGKAMASAFSFEFVGPFVETLSQSDAVPGPWHRREDAGEVELASFDVVFMRKDPPLNMQYVYTTYLLERAADAGVLVVNRPDSLRNCNEKLFATEFEGCHPPLVVTQSAVVIREFAEQHGDVILKQLDGMGGTGVFLARRGDPNLSVMIEMLTQNARVPIMAQEYLPDISQGDKRILLVDGEPGPYALARIPASGETRGNLAAGGRGEVRELSDRDKWIVERVRPVVQEKGLLFVGLDVIGDYLTEINVTCPTCVREIADQTGVDMAQRLIDRVAVELG